MTSEADKKYAPKPSQASVNLSAYFELELVDVAIKAYEKKEYLKSAMMSWSFIEEYFLPTQIEFIAKRQKIKIKEDLFNTNVYHLLKYYFLISYDQELYEILVTACSLRNQIIHKAYRSGSIKEIARKAQDSAKFNLYTAMNPMLNRLKGDVPPPSLTLYSKGWNDCRDKMLKNITDRKTELELELKNLNAEK